MQVTISNLRLYQMAHPVKAVKALDTDKHVHRLILNLLVIHDRGFWIQKAIPKKYVMNYRKFIANEIPIISSRPLRVPEEVTLATREARSLNTADSLSLTLWKLQYGHMNPFIQRDIRNISEARLICKILRLATKLGYKIEIE